MSNPNIPGDNKELSKRFRRLLDSREDEDASDQTLDESNLGETDRHELPQEVVEDSEVDVQVQPEVPESDLTPESSGNSEIDDQVLPELPESDSSNILDNESVPDESEEGSNSTPEGQTLPERSEEQAARPPTSNGITRRIAPPIDEYGMPLPGRVNRTLNQSNPVRPQSTKNLQSQQRTVHPSVNYKPRRRVRPDSSSGVQARRKPKNKNSRISPSQGGGCFFRMLILAILAGVIILLVGGSFIVYEYYKIAATLPSVADLQQRASTFETTRIFDRNDNLLYEILDPSAGRG